jgi:hypothetical protein
MDLSRGEIVDAPHASAPVDITDEADSTDTEFWDACWTLEEEWLPGVVVQADSRPLRRRTQPPEFFVLL